MNQTIQKKFAAQQADEAENDGFISFHDPQSQYVFSQVKDMAEVYLNQYLTQRPELLANKAVVKDNFDQWLWVYIIHLLPEYLLQEILFKSCSQGSKGNFRKLCILVHPDKNSHELASRSFQRLLAAFKNGSAS